LRTAVNPSLAEGLAYDKCSVGVVTDVGWQALLPPLTSWTPSKTFKVARTQVDVVLPTGTAVLNAADPQVVEMAELCDGKVIFYGMDANQAAMAAHRAAGEKVVFVRDARSCWCRAITDGRIVAAGIAQTRQASQPEMVMAAVAAAWALNIAPELIGAGLAHL
jgi:cyanophycin synthetase